MKKNIFILLIIIPFNLFSQEVKISKVLIDSNTKLPIENATINNGFEFTASNSDGHFTFVTKKDSIKINLLGYNPYYKKINEIQYKDTIYLVPTIINLDEVVIKNSNSIISTIFENITNTTPDFKYSEKFFLRIILKKNDSIIKFQDIIGLIERKKRFVKNKRDSKKNVKIQLLNMRKVGLLAKSKKTENVNYFSFSELFFRVTEIYANPKLHNFKNEGYLDRELQKISFTPKKPYSNNSFRGYYVINSEKKSIIEAVLEGFYPTPYREKRGFKWRIVSSELNVKFNYNHTNKKHHISQAILCYKLVVITPEQKKNVYEVKHNLFTTESFTNKKVKKNIRSNKIIFDTNVSYDKSFWDSQNHLLFDNSLESFIKSTEKKYIKEKYKVITNLKNHL